jgi:hypothetical protein
MVAYFSENKIKKVDVVGNAESLYFALEGDTTTTGMNKAVSATMALRFAANKLQTITFQTNPDASFIPPHELKEPDKTLKGMQWRIKERPSRRATLGKHFAPPAKAKPKKSAPKLQKSPPKPKPKAAPNAKKPAQPITPAPAAAKLK